MTSLSQVKVTKKAKSGDDYYDQYIFPLMAKGRKKKNWNAFFFSSYWLVSKGLYFQYLLMFIPLVIFKASFLFTDDFSISIYIYLATFTLFQFYISTVSNKKYYNSCLIKEPLSFTKSLFLGFTAFLFYLGASVLVITPWGQLVLIAENIFGAGTPEAVLKEQLERNLSSTRFNFPTGGVSDGKNLYITDTGNNCIRKIQILTGISTTFAGTPGSRGHLNGKSFKAKFNYPTGITIAGSQLFVADSMNHSIRMIDINSGEVTTLAGSGGHRGSVDGIGSNARFGFPIGIATDGKNLYVADAGNNIIRKINILSRDVTTIAGEAGMRGSEDGLGSTVRFNFPSGLTLNKRDLFISDTDNHIIRKMDLDTLKTLTLVGNSEAPGDFDGTSENARFRLPVGITNDGINLFLADLGNHTISTININTKTSVTKWGISNLPGSWDGAGGRARFNYPAGIFISGMKLYVVDSKNYALRKIDILSGKVSTFAGVAGVAGSENSDKSFLAEVPVTEKIKKIIWKIPSNE